MDTTIKTLLILLAFVVIAVLLLKPSCCDCENKKESYVASFDPAYADPRVNFYSKNITFRPDMNVPIDSTITDTMLNSDGYAQIGTDPDKLFDQLADQDLGVSVGGDSQDDVDRRRMRGILPKQVRFMTANGQEENDTAPVRDIMPKSSFYSSDINVDRRNETNNIVNYCVHNKKFDRETVAYADQVHDALDMDVDDIDNYDMAMAVSNLKTFNQVNEDAARFDIVEENVKDINTLGDITKVMNDLRNKSMSTILGNYQGADRVPGGKQMYN